MPAPPLSSQDLEHVTGQVSAWDDLRGGKLLITGGTGFFGCWLLETFLHANRALNLNATATVLTRDPARFLGKMPHLAGSPELTYVSGDVRQFGAEALPAKAEFSHVIHAATASSSTPEECGPLEMFETVVEGTRRVLDVAVKTRARRFLHTSSGAVYGVQPPDLTNVSEEYSGAPDPMKVNSSYGVGKLAAEWLCTGYGQEFSCSTARCFAFIGPHLPLHVHFAIGNFLRDARGGGPLRIQGDGTPYRSYLYAADLTWWLWEILLRGAAGRAYNVGSEQAVSILETAQAVASCFNPSPQIEVAKKCVAGMLPSRYVPSTARARTELNLEQKISFEEGLRRTLRFLDAS